MNGICLAYRLACLKNLRGSNYHGPPCCRSLMQIYDSRSTNLYAVVVVGELHNVARHPKKNTFPILILHICVVLHLMICFFFCFIVNSNLLLCWHKFVANLWYLPPVVDVFFYTKFGRTLIIYVFSWIRSCTGTPFNCIFVVVVVNFLRINYWYILLEMHSYRTEDFVRFLL